MSKLVLWEAEINTPLGAMISLTSDQAVYFLQFVESVACDERKKAVIKENHAVVKLGESAIYSQLVQELAAYFRKERQAFTVPIHLQGTVFQQKVWQALQAIPYGSVRSYQQLAQQLHHEKAVRAVGNANGKNPIAIIVPCHRVVRYDGSIGGYAGGVERKQKLLQYEDYDSYES